MKQDSKVSILLPLYNGKRYLNEAIDSVLAQTYENFELVISDNCSTDGSYEIAQEYASRDKRIRLSRNDRNIGPLPNYRKVMMESTGEYIELFSHDDVFAPTCIQKFVAILDALPNVVIVTSNRNCMDEHGNLYQAGRPKGSLWMEGKEAIRSNLDMLGNWISSPVMYRSEFKGSGFNERLQMYGDIDYWCQMLMHGDFFYLDETLFNYRYHKNSGSVQFLKELLFAMDLVRMVDRYGDCMSIKSKTDVRKLQVDRMLSWADNVLQQGHDFEEILKPCEIDFTRRDLSELEIAKLDAHDFRRAACLVINHAINLNRQFEASKLAWQQERSNLLSKIPASEAVR